MVRYQKAYIRELVRETVLAPDYDTSELDSIRLDVYFKLTGSRSWPDDYQATNAQIASVLGEMAEAGELVKTGGASGTKGWRSRSAVHFRTPARHAEHVAEMARRQAEAEDQGRRWPLVWERLTELGFASPGKDNVSRSNRDYAPWLALDQWERLADLAAIALRAQLPLLTNAREALEGKGRSK